MIGLPPTAGFITKWQLGVGALDSPHPWVLAVLVVSSLLNAAYFLPMIYNLWFAESSGSEEVDVTEDHQVPAPAGSTADASGAVPAADPAAGADADEQPARVKEPLALLVPAALTALFTLLVGLAASVWFAPLEVARYIAEGVFS